MSSAQEKRAVPVPPNLAAVIACICRDAGQKADGARRRADQARKQGLMQKVQRYQGEARAYDWICDRLHAEFLAPEVPR